MSYSQEYLAIKREWWLRDLSLGEGDVMFEKDTEREFVYSSTEHEDNSHSMVKIYLPESLQNIYELA